MNSQHFQSQIFRLMEVFGKNAFPKERVELIWREVQDLSEPWFTRTIDKFIGEFRQYPLMPDFREEIAKERERLWRLEKQQHAKDAQELWNSSYPPDDIRTLCQMIVKRVQGGVTDTSYASFKSMLKNVANSNPKLKPTFKCYQCEDTGLIVYCDDQSLYQCACKVSRS